MPPKKILASSLPPSIKRPPHLKSSTGPKKGESELDQLLRMGPAELYPYVCLVLAIVLLILYNIVPSLLKYIVEFQYPVEKEKQPDTNVPLPPAIEFFHIGPLDSLHLLYIYLGVVGFQIFLAELLQGIAKYILKTPKKSQEIFVAQATYMIFHVVTLASGFGLISSDIFADPQAIWNTTKPITRTLKFYLLIQIAFQVSYLVQYLIHRPASSWKVTTVGGYAFGAALTAAAYFSGFSVPILLLTLAFDMTSVAYEFWLLTKTSLPRQFSAAGFHLRRILNVSWILNRVVVPLITIPFFLVNAFSPAASTNTSEEQPEVAQGISVLHLGLLAGLAVLAGIQLLWFQQIKEKFATKSK